MSISVENLSKWYGAQEAVKSISFNINKGEVVGFIGPNGAGKSTTMKIITGYLAPDTGIVNVCGIDVMKNPVEAKRHIGYLPENNPLYLNMYIKEYLSFVAGLYKLPKPFDKLVDEMIDITGLGIESKKQIGQLSKGYRQRVGLAQALIHNPDVLILDEPTSGLDPNQVIEIRELITRVGKEKTIMLSTHIMQEVEAICDRIMIINNGSLITDQSTETIHTATEEMQTFLVEFKELLDETFFTDIHGVLKTVALNSNTWLIGSAHNIDIREGVFKKAVEKGVTILQLQRKEKKLEDVFRELTR